MTINFHITLSVDECLLKLLADFVNGQQNLKDAVDKLKASSEANAAAMEAAKKNLGT